MNHAVFIGDSIEDLPTDQAMPSHSEITIVDSIFKKNQGVLERVFVDAKDAILVGVLFALFVSPQMESFLKKFFPSMESVYMSIFIRAVVFMLIYYVLKNLHVVRR